MSDPTPVEQALEMLATPEGRERANMAIVKALGWRYVRGMLWPVFLSDDPALNREMRDRLADHIRQRHGALFLYPLAKAHETIAAWLREHGVATEADALFVALVEAGAVTLESKED